MGGRIWVESEVGKGSTFHFTARVGLSSSPVSVVAPVEGEKLIGLPVLVVDDNLTNQRVLKQTLQQWAMVPSVASGARQALDMLQEAQHAGNPFTLVLTDAHMPQMDGFALAEKIKQTPELSDVTMLMMLSSAGHAAESTRCRAIGVSAYLVKPSKQPELFAAMLTALGQAKIRTQHRQVVTPDETGKGKRLNVLLVEDNEVNQKLVMRLLQKAGHNVTIANHGLAALKILESNGHSAFDIVLMDLDMPEMNGIDANGAIRAKEKIAGTHLPVIAMTAHAMKGDRERCLAAGMDGYISKPISQVELFAALAQIPSTPKAEDRDSRPMPW